MSRVARWVVFGVPAFLVWACSGGSDVPSPGGGGESAGAGESGRGGDQSSSHGGAAGESLGGAQASAGAGASAGGALGVGGYADVTNGCDGTCPYFQVGRYELEMTCTADSESTWKSSCGGDTIQQIRGGVTRTYHFDADHELVGVMVEQEELGAASQTYGKSCTRVGPIKDLCAPDAACHRPLTAIDLSPFDPNTPPHHDSETTYFISDNDCSGVNLQVYEHDSSHLISYGADNNAVGALYVPFFPSVCDDGSVGYGTLYGALCESLPGNAGGAGGTGSGGANGNGGAH